MYGDQAANSGTMLFGKLALGPSGKVSNAPMKTERSPLTVVVAQWQTIDAFLQALTTPAEYRVAPSASDEDVAPLLAGADALISARFSPALTEAADSLRLILTPGA